MLEHINRQPLSRFQPRTQGQEPDTVGIKPAQVDIVGFTLLAVVPQITLDWNCPTLERMDVARGPCSMAI
jgi:hypothetical protein